MNRPKSAPSRKPKAPPRRAAPAVSEVAVPPVAAQPPAERIEPVEIAEPRGPATIDLALQGGGSHGAFTWGVLDALLEDGRLGFDGVSGTSAGAMNAAVLACGFARGGRDGARAALRAFWVAWVPRRRRRRSPRRLRRRPRSPGRPGCSTPTSGRCTACSTPCGAA